MAASVTRAPAGRASSSSVSSTAVAVILAIVPDYEVARWWPCGKLAIVGFIDVVGVRHTLPDGRVLLDDVNFRVGEGSKAALVGANGAGKTTLLRVISGDLAPQAGSVASWGGLGVMRQFIGSVRDATTVQDFLVGLAPGLVREAWAALQTAELALMDRDDERRSWTTPTPSRTGEMSGATTPRCCGTPWSSRRSECPMSAASTAS